MLRLRTLRDEKGLTIEKVAEELTRICEASEKYGIEEVSPASYGSWERGDRNPSLNQLCLLADYYQVSTDFLLEKTDIRLEKAPSMLEELGIDSDPWWEIKREVTHDERACAKVFARIVSGKSFEKILGMTDDKDWRESKWGEKPDTGTVQAMLMRALDDGAVGIIIEKLPQDEGLAKALKTEFKFLQEVKVVKIPKKVVEGPENELLAKILVGEAAAQFFDEIVRPGHKVGLSGGTTLARMATALKKYPCQGIKLYPFDSGLMPETADICANTLIGRIKYSHPASNIDAYALQYFGFDDSRRPYSFPPNRPSVKEVLFGAENVDVGFVGFGAMTHELLREDPAYSHVLNVVRMSPDELIGKYKVVGNILFHCIQIDGKCVIEENKQYKRLASLNKRIQGVRPSRLRRLAEDGKPIVGVASGAIKGKAGLGVINGRYVNNLVIDDKLAAAILEAKEQFDQEQT